MWIFCIGGVYGHLFLHLQVIFLSLLSQSSLIVLSSICLFQLHSSTTTTVIACVQIVQNLTLDTQKLKFREFAFAELYECASTLARVCISGRCVHLFRHFQVILLRLPSQCNLVFLSSICLLQLHRGTTTAVIACVQNVRTQLNTGCTKGEVYRACFCRAIPIIKLHRVCLGRTDSAHISIKVH